MSNMLNLFGFTNVDPVESDHQKSGKTTLLSVHALRSAAARLADLRADGASLNTREFVGLLVCNAQRNRRISQPEASVRVARRDQQT